MLRGNQHSTINQKPPVHPSSKDGHKYRNKSDTGACPFIADSFRTGPANEGREGES